MVSRTVAARRVAYETLRAVHESDAYANLLLPTAISRAGLSTADAALATELTYGTLRRQGTYDAAIAPSPTSIPLCSTRCVSACISSCRRGWPPTPR